MKTVSSWAVEPRDRNETEVSLKLEIFQTGLMKRGQTDKVLLGKRKKPVGMVRRNLARSDVISTLY